MKFPKIFIVAVVMTGLAATSVFAAPAVTDSPKQNSTEQKSDTLKNERSKTKRFRLKQKGFNKEHKDPLEMLQSRRQKVQELLNEGKISKEKADQINAEIDVKIKEVQEFNSLTLDQKKEKLQVRLKEKMDEKVKEGKLTREKADEFIEKFNKKIEEWDGTGYPGYMHKMHWKKGNCKKYFEKKE